MENSLEIKNSETQEIIDLASKIQPVIIGGFEHVSHLALPPGWNSKEINNESLLLNPQRKKGTTTITELESFVEYINRHKIEHLTSIYCTADYARSEIKFTGIINDHDGDANGQHWRDFRVVYAPEFSEEWKRWTRKNNEPQTQAEFATFIEDNINDIATAEGMPSGKDLYEMALSFEANQDMTFRSKVRLQSGGIEFSLTDTDDAQTVEKMKLFEKIAIGIPVFWGGGGYEIKARLKYRVNQGALKFWYELIRQDKVIEDATKTMIKDIKIKTGLPLYFGTI